MKKQYSFKKTKHLTFMFCVFLLLSILFLSTCGYDDTADYDANDISETGSFSCTLKWPDDIYADKNTSHTSRSLDCQGNGIDVVAFTFYKNSDSPLRQPDEFDCDRGYGKADKLPPGSNYRVMVTAEDATGTVLYHGDLGYSFVIVAGETMPGGEIFMEPVPPGMALIPSGCFDMGDAFTEGDPTELPVHYVCITSSFYMDVHEVTNEEYAACVSAGWCTAPSSSSSNTRGSYYGNPTYDDFPVIYVSWNRANDYCTWVGKRLPTEAEWEYAARGGLSGKRYPWGDTISGTDANYSGSGDPWGNDTSPVEYYAANGYGLYDMVGNVWEWVNDWYQSDYYGVSPTIDPPGPDSGTYRVLRGGSWYNDTHSLRVANRHDTVANQNNSMGFRCAGD